MSTPHAHHHDEPHPATEAHDLGLSHDLPRLVERSNLGRRRILGLLGGVGVLAATGCAADSATSASSSTSGDRPSPPDGGPGGGAPDGGSSVEVSEGEIPEETAGPYPGDGTNGPNVLTEAGVVREDITASFGSASGVADGVPLTVRLKVYDLNGKDVSALPGAAIYLWHCDAAGSYSMYDGDAVGENYLRGVQEADDDGWLSFTTIVPGCYAGRWPHLHFEVYESLDAATAASTKLRTSQLALPQDFCETVYGDDRYAGSAENLAAVSLDSDGIFSDGHSLQMAAISGSESSGWTATLRVPV